jgi:AcrR family transcriptional regulator
MSSEAETRKQKQERTRAELIAAAGRVFARRGYHGASVEEVAAEAGYSTGAVYSNFKGKEELFLALNDHELENRLEDYCAVVEALDSPQGAEETASGRFGDFFRDDPDWPLVFFEFWAYGARNERLREEFVKQREAEVKIIATAVERQTAAAGVQLPLPADKIAVGIGALINGLAFERTLDPDSVPDELFGLILSRLIVGLLADLGDH